MQALRPLRAAHAPLAIGARPPAAIAPLARRTSARHAAASSATPAAAETRNASSAVVGTSGSAAAAGPSSAEHRAFMMEDTRLFLAQDLKKLFETGSITTSRYSKDIKFEDPITKYNDLDGYLFMIRMLRTLFTIGFKLHKIEVTASDTITASWTMSMEFWLAPWRPSLLFTGRSIYRVQPDTGLVLAHTDEWDSLDNNKFLSLEAVQHVLRMFMQVQLTPSLQGPRYQVLKKTKLYEIRKYEPYLVAEAAMPAGSGPAAGSGFNDLAAYIFGNNSQSVRMEMTTPVMTAAAPGASAQKMQFVMEPRFSSVELLPPPNDARVSRRSEPGYYCAALAFPGWPLDHEVVAAEKQLRGALQADRLSPQPGHLLARYNDPSTPPMLRRNEVLIKLDKFEWPEPEGKQ